MLKQTAKQAEPLVMRSSRPQPMGAYLLEVWRFRHLVVVLARRDLKVKYAQTLLGLLWSFIQPLTGLLIFTLFFDQLIELPIAELPYPLFVMPGIMGWFYFSYLVGGVGTSLMENQDLIKKVYFPRLVLPLAKTLVGLVELAIATILLALLMLLLGWAPGWQVLFFPLFVVWNTLAGLAVAIWLAALTIRYRDFYHIIPYIVNFGIWLTPVFYPTTLVHGRFESILFWNPMAGVVEGYRWCLLGLSGWDPRYLLGLAPVLLLVITGLSYFRRVERQIADWI